MEHTQMELFVKDAVKTESRDINQIAQRFSGQREIRLMHMAVGLTTESAEIMDAFKKYLFYGKPLDLTNLREELGDLLWYIAIGCDEMGWSFEQLAVLVINKLRTRYPQQEFRMYDAVERDLDAERRALEAPPSDYFPADRIRVVEDNHGNSAAYHEQLWGKHNPRIAAEIARRRELEADKAR